jgi:hypothetical protein
MHDLDDPLIASYVTEIRKMTKDVSTSSKLTICYNLMLGILRLFCVLGDKKDVLKLADEFHAGLIEEIESMYDEK